MTETSFSKRRRFMDNAGHMSPDHVERLRQLSQSSGTTEGPDFLHNLRDSDQELAGGIGEETVANMTSGQQQPRSDGTLEDLADLSIDVPVDADADSVVDAGDSDDLDDSGQ